MRSKPKRQEANRKRFTKTSAFNEVMVVSTAPRRREYLAMQPCDDRPPENPKENAG